MKNLKVTELLIIALGGCLMGVATFIIPNVVDCSDSGEWYALGVLLMLLSTGGIVCETYRQKRASRRWKGM